MFRAFRGISPFFSPYLSHILNNFIRLILNKLINMKNKIQMTIATILMLATAADGSKK